MMIDQFTSYSTKLERLSNDELHRSAEKLVLAENTTIAKLIAHLAEMSSRKTALELGYKSLYEYCIIGLNLSEGAVPARIHVANVSRRFPQLLVALAESHQSHQSHGRGPSGAPPYRGQCRQADLGLRWDETEGDRGVHCCLQAEAGLRAVDPEAPCASGARGVTGAFNVNINITGAFTSSRTRRDAEEFPNHSAAPPVRKFSI